MPTLSPPWVPPTRPLSSAIDPSLLYPEGDGEPMAEAREHLLSLTDLFRALVIRFENDPTVYVGGDSFIYYYDADGKIVRIAPDVFVIKGLRRPHKGSYRVWEGNGRLAVVFEFLSPSSRDYDLQEKYLIYQDYLRVPEYFVFDPRPEADREFPSSPRLLGFRLVDGRYEPIPLEDGRLHCRELDMDLMVRDEELAVYDRSTGAWLRNLGEAERAARSSLRQAHEEARRAEAEAEARQRAERRAEAADERADAAEAEIQRLRELLRTSQR